MSAYRTTYKGYGLESWRAASRYEHRNWCMVVQYGIEYFVGFTASDARAFIDQLRRKSMSKATDDVMAERQRQIESEGWAEEHDDRHDDRSLALAGVCYAQQYAGRAWLLEDYADGAKRYQADGLPDDWPDSWAVEWWKPKTPRRDLVRAAALLIAEIERLDRAALVTPNVKLRGAL